MNRATIPLLCLALVGILWSTRVSAGELDCDNNGVPDAEELSGNDCNANALLDVCENDMWTGAVELSSVAFGTTYSGGNADIDGDVAVVGDPRSLSLRGQIRVYSYSPDTGWILDQQIQSPTTATGPLAFGDQVTVRGDWIAATMPGYMVNGVRRGAVLIYRRDADQWVLDDMIEGPFRNVFFGQRIALEGNRLFVQVDYLSGTPSADGPQVLIYINRHGNWVLEQRIRDGSPRSLIPMRRGQRAFSVQGNRLITLDAGHEEIYENGDYGGGYDVEQLVIHELSNGQWTPISRISTWIGNTPENFGFGALATSANQMVIGYPRIFNGSVLIVRQIEGEWKLTDRIDGILGQWIEPMGDSYWVGSESTISRVYDLQIGDGDPSVTYLAELDNTFGVGRRSGNWWVFQRSNPLNPVITPINTRSDDCDEDGLLDECAIASGAADVDGNRVPDSCEMDCNGDGIPDASQLILNDCNANGILDACDVDPADPDADGLTWADCNGNLLPDACDADCDQNHIPDDCDLDVTDPDGDGLVAADCNANGVPDTCEMRRELVEIGVLRPGGEVTGLTYGAALSADQDVVAIGAPATTTGSGVIGRVFVYRRSDSLWNEEAVVLPELSVANGTFGEKLLIQGDTLLIGSRGATTSTVSVYQYTDGAWQHRQAIETPGALAGRYGFSIDGDRMVIASDTGNTIRIYERQSADWIQTQSVSELPNAGTFEGDILLRDDYLIVRYAGMRVIAYYHYSYGWYYRSEAKGGSGITSTFLDEARVVTGAPTNICGELQIGLCGKVEISRLIDGRFFREAAIFGPRDPLVTATHFGATLAVFGDRLVVGGPLAGGNAGRIYYYERDGANWVLRQEIDSPLAPAALNFGSRFAIGGDSLFVSATDAYPTFQETDEDAVFIYETDHDVDDDDVYDACQPDCDGNRLPDAWELARASVASFVAELLRPEPSCAFDANDDGAVNGLDVAEFIALLLEP